MLTTESDAAGVCVVLLGLAGVPTAIWAGAAGVAAGAPEVLFSEELPDILDTGGGIVQASLCARVGAPAGEVAVLVQPQAAGQNAARVEQCRCDGAAQDGFFHVYSPRVASGYQTAGE